MTAPHSDDHPFPPDPADLLAPSPADPPTGAVPGRPPAGPEPGSAGPPQSHAPAGEGGFRMAQPIAPVEVERNGFQPPESAVPSAAAPSGSAAAAASTPTPGASRAGEHSVAAGDGEGAAGMQADSEGAGADHLTAAVRPGVGAGDVWPTDEALEAVELDDTGWTRRNLEAILLVADEPVPATTLAELVGARLTQVEALLIDLAGEYAGQGRGFVLRAVAGGWRLYTHPATREVVDAYLRAGQQSRLTRAALETLAVIAYRQPVTRHQVAAVRGVNVDGVFRTLAGRGLIHEVGHEEGPGQAALYATTPAFLEQLGLTSLDQLPPIKDYLPDGVDLTDLLEQT
jgi:segregation and condensation protein B